MTPADLSAPIVNRAQFTLRDRPTVAPKLVPANDVMPRTIRTVMRGRWLESIVDAAIVALIVIALVLGMAAL